MTWQGLNVLLAMLGNFAWCTAGFNSGAWLDDPIGGCWCWGSLGSLQVVTAIVLLLGITTPLTLLPPIRLFFLFTRRRNLPPPCHRCSLYQQPCWYSTVSVALVVQYVRSVLVREACGEVCSCCCCGLLAKCSAKGCCWLNPVGTEGSKGLKALAVAPVLLMTDGILPSSTAVHVLLFVQCLHLHLVLSLSVWLLGRENEMCFIFCASDRWQMALRSWSCTCSSVLTWLVRGA